MGMRAGTLCRILFATLALLLAADSLRAQPRPCLDLSGDHRVDFADVAGGHRVAALLDGTLDPRPDFDLAGGVTVTDVVNELLVARGDKPALVDFEPRAAAAGQRVRAFTANVPRDARDLRVVLRGAVGELEATEVTAGEGFVDFRLPDFGAPAVLDLPGLDRALPGIDRRGLLLVRLELGNRSSNVCPLLALAAGERDRDGDGLRDAVDTCPDFADPQNGDTDADGLGDYCDNCPATPNRDQKDANGDGSGDACEPPRKIAVNGVELAPPRGVDPRMRQAGVERPHGVLILTREIDMHLQQRLEELGVVLGQPLGRHAFVVAALPRSFEALAGELWFHALVPLEPNIRLVGALRDARIDPAATYELDVQFHDDVTLDEARRALHQVAASVLSEGVELRDECGKLSRRVNTWRVRLLGRGLGSLAEHDGVLAVQLAHPNLRYNANSRAALRVDVVNTGGLNGTGRVVGEWDGGWVDGDNLAPPAAPAGGVNAGFGGRVRIRDHGPDGVPALPGGCGAAVSCTAPFCAFDNHATHVGGTMIGDGTLAGGGPGTDRGMANLAQLISYEWPDSAAELVCERRDAMAGFGTVAHNNSWGYCHGCNGTLGFYDALSSSFDQEIRARPEALDVFAAANAQNFRNSPFGTCPATVLPCALPPIYTAPACTAPPPGVAPPPALAVPPLSVVNRFYTVNAPGATTKNSVVVGSVAGTPTFGTHRLSNFSSLGPTQDGRLKPEVTALGGSVTSTCVPGLTDGTGACGANGYLTIGGTSMAAPAVTGTAALLFERATAIPVAPFDGSEARALMIHTATDLDTHPGGAFVGMTGTQWNVFGGGADGPDFLTGYGRVDAAAARDHLNAGNVAAVLQPSGCPTSVAYASIPFHSPVDVGGAGPVAGCPAMVWDVVWYVTVPAGLTQMKVTLAWNDVQATAGANPTLVNDIDLMVEAPGGVYHYPWWLDPACPYRQAVRVQANAFAPAIYGDHRNNLEQVHVIGPLAAGTWRIIIRTDGLASGPQPFSLMVSMN